MRKLLALFLMLFGGLITVQAAGPSSLLLRNGSIEMPANAQQFANTYHPGKDKVFEGRSYLVVQFAEIPKQEVKEAIEKDGVGLFDYLPNNAYLASIPKGYDLNRLIAAGARSFMEPNSAIRFSKALYSGQYPAWALSGTKIDVTVLPYDDVSKDMALIELSKYFQIINETPHPKLIQIRLETSRLFHLLQFPLIQYIEPIAAPSTPDDFPGRSLHRSNVINADYGAGRHYDGTGMTVALADDGNVGPHIDFEGRLTQFSTSNNGTHGDMTAGIFFGAGNREPKIQGHASGAEAYYWSISGYVHVVSAVSNYNTYNIVLSSTSYSQGQGGVYTNDTRFIDQQIYDNRQLVHMFSAGNAGSANHGYGAGAGWGNITGGYKAAKSVITCGDMNNNGVLESTSSRGPADDGRIKPDICANGRGQLSTDENNTTQVGGGTSAACPSVAGTVTQLYHAYKTLNGGANPESGLIKGCILNTGNEAGNPGPDYKHGWGSINALRAVRTLEQNRYMLDSVTQSQSRTHTINIPANTHEVRVMVYWTDYQGNPSASKALVNDLNIKLNVGGVDYNPWVLDETPSAAALDANATRGIDDLNNMEQVTLTNPAAGNATLTVTGMTVPQGPQRYWVVYEFVQAGIEVTYPIGGEGFVPGETEKIRWDANGIVGNFTIEYSTNSGTSWNTIVASTNNSLRTRNWTVPSDITSNARVRVTGGGHTGESVEDFTIARLPSNINITYVCPDSIGITWNAAAGATGYEVSILGSKYMDSVATTSGATSATIYNQNPQVEHWYSVRSLVGNGKGRRAIAVRRAGGTFNCSIPIDAEMTAIVSPGAGGIQSCQASATSDIVVTVTNTGTGSISNIPVYYSFNGGGAVMETIAGPLAAGASINHTFATTVNLSTPGTYTLETWVDLLNDGNYYNDTLMQSTSILTGTVVNLPVTQDFESFGTCGTGSDCGSTICTLGSGWTNSANGSIDDIDWRVDRGGTPSNNTGPSTDHNPGTSTGKYVYLEASGGCTGQVAELLTPCIDLAGATGPQLTFWYHLYGAAMGELHVDVIAEGAWTLDVMPVLSGNKGNSWQSATVNLAAFNGKVINVRFRGITGNNFTSDMALDDINIIESSTPPVAAFTGSPLSTCPGNVVTFTDQTSNNPTSWAWTITPSTFSYVNGTSASSQNPEVTFSAAGNYSVTLVATNPFGNNTATQNNYISITTGLVPNIVEDFQGTFLPAGWSIVDPGGSLTWQQSASITGSNGSPTFAAVMENFNYNNQGAEDMLVTTPIDLASLTTASMTFDLAYARINGTLVDELKVDVSTDCGATFPNTVYQKSDVSLATAPDHSGSFAPSAADEWRNELVDLTPFVGQTIVIRFVGVNGWGNNLYIDNVNLLNFVGVQPSVGDLDIQVYPNPSTGLFEMQISSLPIGDASMTVHDLTGRQVWAKDIVGSGSSFQSRIDLSNLSKGVYYLRVDAEGMRAVQKLVVE